MVDARRWMVALAVLGLLSGVMVSSALAKDPVEPKSRGQSKGSAAGYQPANLPIIQRWEGSYPVVNLDKLPRGQQKSATGFIGDERVFSDVWKNFKPGERMPKIDFKKSLVVFSRNMKFYNRIAITKVRLVDGTAEILGVETLTSTPVSDRVAMALAEIPREGVKSVKSGERLIPVK